MSDHAKDNLFYLHILEDYESILDYAFYLKRKSSQKYDSITDYYVAIADYRLGNTSYAKHLFTTMLLNPEISMLCCKYLGNIYGEEGDYKTSMFYFDQCKEALGHTIDFLVNTGCNYFVLKDYKKALDQFQKAKSLYPHLEYLDTYIKMVRSKLPSE
jgi:tetratricopeptide (TPR) repeat protein